MAEEGHFPHLLNSQRLFHLSNPCLKSVKEAMLQNLYQQRSPSGPSNDEVAKNLIGPFFTILFVLLCCCCCCSGQHDADDDQQDRQVESGTNSSPTTTGDNRLDSVVPSSLPVFIYSTTAHEGRLECSLCLTEFKDGEVGRFLPRCCHGFHKDCVDVWLNAHSTCPLCRSSVELGTPDLAV